MRKALLAAALAAVVVQGTAWAQTTDPATYRLTGTRIAFGQDVRVERDEEVSDAAIVIGGSLTVDGRVRDGVVVVGRSEEHTSELQSQTNLVCSLLLEKKKKTAT